MPFKDFNDEHREVLDEMLLDIPGVKAGKMFGLPGYYADGKLFACVWEDGVSIKLPEEIRVKMLKRKGVEPFVPMMMFAILFGLSMDYEVFLLSRIREEWLRTGNPRTSVADGLAATARVITAAAAIMAVVFLSFVLEDARSVKLLGLGFSIAVLLDASIVRMLLVPATMELLGARNWWLPRWLDRILPHFDVERPTVSPSR